MRQTTIVLFLLTVFLASLALPQSTAATRKASSKKTTTATKTPARKGKPSSKSAKRAPVAAYRQTAPTPERYREIQQALVDKGYLKSEPNGIWDADSTVAMTKFQIDRNLSPTGKLSSASLIALGLGPSTAPIPPVPAPKASEEPPSVPSPSN